MLDTAMLKQLEGYLAKIVEPVSLVASVDDTAGSKALVAFLEQIASLTPQIDLTLDGKAQRCPSFSINRVGTDIEVSFAGIPTGHEFSSLVLALLQVGGHPPTASQDVLDRVRGLDRDCSFEVFISLSCHNCPDVVQALNLMSVVNPRIRVETIDGALFQDEVEARQVMAVPSVFLDGELFDTGRVGLEDILARLDTDGADGEKAKLSAKVPFDVLTVGGGPAGASAALYAARKGIRTGVVAERFGGQLLDTLGIENLVAVERTEGPKLAAELERNVRDNDVDVINRQRAVRLMPAPVPGGLHKIELESGATLQARTIVLSTGARWRQLNVPGEREYANAGVAHCPHCDGPLFKGKRVAVVGGGNSGVEAAIDLAGIVGHVTLLEFADTLRADEVLQRKLRGLANVDILTGAQTTQVLGDGKRVSGLRFENRADGTSHDVDLEGVFVQIGLLPNTAWLEGTVELSAHGEIVIGDHGETSVPGVFAAGDCTDVPYKQIVVALGAGSTAVLGAFDHLIRTAAPELEAA